MNAAEVTIGYCPRERFSTAPETLRRILANTTVPYRLIIVDCGTPAGIWREIESQLHGRDNVTVIRRDEFLFPSACKNLIIEATDTEFVCLIENDVRVEPGWAEKFLASARKHGADVVAPLIYEVFEGRPERAPRPHFDDDLGSIRPVDTPEGERLHIEPRSTSRFDDPGTPARPEEFVEAHCLFFRRDLFDRMPQFDGECSASDEVDISMAIRAAGGSVIFDPECTVTFIQPALPVSEVDREYFLRRWDPELAGRSHRRLMERWKLAEPPQLLGFWHERHARGGDTLLQWRDELRTLASGRPIILVDGEQFRTSKMAEGLETIPFTEKNGEYWGDPADDEAALRELEKDLAAKAGLMVFTWNTFWYFSHYERLNDHLRKNFAVVVDDDRMVVFDLQARKTPDDV